MSSENKECEGPVQCSEKNNNATHKTQVDIVCVSPNSGNLYPSRVLLTADTPGISDIDDGTSETSRRLREEVRSVYKEIFTKPTEKHAVEEMEDDREICERELRIVRNRDEVTQKRKHRSLPRISERDTKKAMRNKLEATRKRE